MTTGLLPELTLGGEAPPPRTLVEIFRATVAAHPEATAVDSSVETMTYAELLEAAEALAGQLADLGIGPGDKVGVRISSGTLDLYVAILGTLVAGAAYVPVDADDPEERARVVFGEAAVAAAITGELDITRFADVEVSGRAGEDPDPADDAWVIFTSGSTGTPKGVAVTHRSAAAFVDAESRIFLQDKPIGPRDRVMAGLSVAFDASCEEIWLAFAHGACLVPAPRSLVRSGVDVGPWLTANQVTIVSTVPTLVALWPPAALERVRLLILGGEAFPPELVTRLQAPGREVWNTYGPTEATVVACAAMVTGELPVRIGLPLAGWDLAVVDGEGRPVAVGEPGELIIGGVGLARYLDPAKDAEKYAPMPSLGWERAYRSGDIVVNDPEGLLFDGRADDQVKIGGRRIELGELDDQLLRLPGVVGAAAAVRATAAGNTLLVGYLTVDDTYDHAVARPLLEERLPAALVPRLAVVDTLPTKTSGKVDRDALPWPLPRTTATGAQTFHGTQAWLAGIWRDVLAAEPTSPRDDFFDFGGGSLTAAQVVSRLRERHPEVVVGDLYAHPGLGDLASVLDEMGSGPVQSDREVRPIPTKTQRGQLAAAIPLRALGSLRWLAWIMLGSTLVAAAVPALGWLPSYPWWVLLVTTIVGIAPPGRMLLAVGLIRFVMRGIHPGSYPRGGKVHLRLWLAGRVQDELAASSLAGAPFFRWYAQGLGAEIAKGVDLHSLPPVTGLLRVGAGAAIEPEVDLSGHWIDGDRVHIGEVRVRARARVGTRSMLGPGADVGKDAQVAPGSYVATRVPDGEAWSGAPARRTGKARGAWSAEDPPRAPGYLVGYGLASAVLASLPGIAGLAGGAVLLAAARDATSLGDLALRVLPWLPVAALVGYATLALLVLAIVRACALVIAPGRYPVRSLRGMAIWTTARVMDEARTWLFPMYSGAITTLWLRLLGARIGTGVEASTVLMIPSLTTVNDHAFLADDTLIGGYELDGGWIRVERVKIGKRAFVGNSGMAAPGRRVPRASLVAVLSAAPRRREVSRGTSYIGSPPSPLRRTADEGDTARTYDPPTRLKVLRGVVETARVLTMVCQVALVVGVALALLALLEVHWLLALVLAGPVLLVAGVVAATTAVLTKWLLVGRHRAGEHPLWSSFVWRNELADTFLEMLAASWFVPSALGTPVLTVWLRALGARIGRGVWCESYWLPEPDLVELQDGATINPGCVVQTHLFHDRVLSMGSVVVREGGTLGPNSVILPAATIGRHATIGPVSLVMRGEGVPSRTRWIGNPIGPWEDEQ